MKEAKKMNKTKYDLIDIQKVYVGNIIETKNSLIFLIDRSYSSVILKLLEFIKTKYSVEINVDSSQSQIICNFEEEIVNRAIKEELQTKLNIFVRERP